MRLVFGAPVALFAPHVGYMPTRIVAWIHNAAPEVAAEPRLIPCPTCPGRAGVAISRAC